MNEKRRTGVASTCRHLKSFQSPPCGKVGFMEDRDSARAVKGVFPAPGSEALSLDVWAIVFGKEPDSVGRLFRTNKVRRRKIGDTYYARPEDVWEAFPDEVSGE